MAERPGGREPQPAYLSTPEQFTAAVVIVFALIAVILPWQLDADGAALWLPVILGAAVFIGTWVVLIRTLLRRSRDPASRPAPEVSRRRSLIASAALLVGALAIATRLFLLD
jgi:hypothetical protein